MNRTEWLWVLGGGCVVSFGGTLTAVSAFRGNFLGAYLGFLLFGGGYRLSQWGVHEAGERSNGRFLDRAWNAIDRRWLRKYGLFAIGVGVATYGGVVGAQSVDSLSPPGLVVAGVGMIGGYVIGHIGINDAYV